LDASTRTIVALSTPSGRGALAVIRLTGDDAQEVFTKVIAEKEKFKKEEPRRIGIYTVINTINTNVDTHNQSDTNNNTCDEIDEVTAVKYNAPYSYTGEGMVEIFCHGGIIIPQKILEQLFHQGAIAAGRGEFSRRALINGKIGVLKAESIRELIDSQTETHMKSAQLAYFGKQSESIEKLKQEIIAVLSEIESRIEFDEDDDVAESKRRQISANRMALVSMVAKLEDEIRHGDKVKALDDGIIVTIAGPANAGKSSLFNEILGYDRSIVHDCPGTTRDIVSERMNFDGVTIKLFDSAGIRETGDAVERLGIDRTKSALAEAHAVLWVTSAMEAFGEEERKGILDAAGILKETQYVDNSNNYGDNQGGNHGGKDRLAVVINKIDVDNFFMSGNETLINNYVSTNNIDKTISSTPKKSYLVDKKRFCEEYGLKYVETSITQKLNRAELFAAISTIVKTVMKDTPTPAIIVNERHRGIVEAIIGDINECLDNFDREEVAAHCLRTALDRLAEFSGHIGSDEVLNSIFDKFCIGK